MEREDITEELAKEVKYYREKAGLEVRRVSEVMDISMQDVTNIINSEIYREVTAEEPSEREERWRMEEVKDLSTRQIVQKLRHFGVDFEEKQFLKDVENFRSAGKLADHWMETHTVEAKGFDEDFIWMAAVILWERLIPDVPNVEQIDEKMQEGYDLLREGKEPEACSHWLDAWELIKEIKPPEATSLKEIDDALHTTQSVHNWCQDIERELRSAGREDEKYYRDLIRYVHEFFETFPRFESDLIDLNMRRAEADSHFELGEFEKGEERYEKLTEKHPDNIYGYLSWGDQYRFEKRKPDPDYEKAEGLYLSGLENAVERGREGDIKAALNRLEALYEEAGDPKKIETVKENYGL